ncbi:MAG: metallophosphoesterase [Lachnospiraceae bacterium]|nr:metallophosphoesterase [Lachnospiraceae bacterium]
MLYIMGDLHGKFEQFSSRIYQANIQLSSNDIIIVCGDFGFIYDDAVKRKQGLEQLKALECEVLFVCGNHENFVEINKCEIVNRYGGPMHKISNNIYHMIRGNIYTICGSSFFAFGGAYSNPNQQPKVWQSQEIPSREEIAYGKNSLLKRKKVVDYIVTHAAPNEIIWELGIVPFYSNTCFTNFLSWILNDIQFKHWFCGHYHIDKRMQKYNFSVLYDNIAKL